MPAGPRAPVRSLLFSTPRFFSLPFAAAIGAAAAFYPAFPSVGWRLVGAAAAAGLGIVLASGKGRGRRLRGASALAFAAGAAAGAAIAWTDARGSERPPAGILPAFSVRELRGRLVSDSVPAKNGFRCYSVAVESVGFAGKGFAGELIADPRGRGTILRLLVRGGPPAHAGSRLRARPGPGRCDEAAPIFVDRVDLEILGPGSRFDAARGAAHEAFRQALSRVGRESKGLVEALVLGSREDLALEDAAAFKAAGCSHVLALSGQHLSVLAVLALAALKPLLGPFGARFGAALLAAVFVWIAGAGPSLLRSVLMVWIAAGASAVDRPQDGRTTLALAFLAALPLDPSAARSPGFTLSYAAIWGLVVLSPRFEFVLDPWLPPLVSKAAAASLGAQAAVTPILVFTFGAFQPIGVLASIASAPLVLALMWWGMGAAAVFSLIPALAEPLAPVADAIYRLLVGVMRLAASVPPVAAPTLAGQAALCAGVAAFAAFVYARPDAEYRASSRPERPASRRRARL